jgi:hypothetical protein
MALVFAQARMQAMRLLPLFFPAGLLGGCVLYGCGLGTAVARAGND